VRTTRRGFLGGVAASLTLAAAARASAEQAGDPSAQGSADFEVRDLALDGDRKLSRRMTLVVPRGLGPRDKLPLLVLLHGLGETGDERAGAFAWLERYGLGTSLSRLLHPPIARTSKPLDFTDAHLAAFNADLSRAPFRGFVVACPYLPNINKAKDPKATLDAYAAWTCDVVLPRARREAPLLEGAAHTAIDGCSLGGFAAIEVFLRRPQAFGSLGAVQAAIGAHRAARYAERIAEVVKTHGARALHLETSSQDPFREANLALSVELTRLGVPHDAVILPGPHDQPWLREVGTLEMLRWHDRQFQKRAPTP